jgi:hypothetical protein
MHSVSAELIAQFGMDLIGMFTDKNEAKRQLAELGFGEESRILASNQYAAKLYDDIVNKSDIAIDPDTITREKIAAAAGRTAQELNERPNLLGEIFILEGYITSLTQLRNTMISTVLKSTVSAQVLESMGIGKN